MTKDKKAIIWSWLYHGLILILIIKMVLTTIKPKYAAIKGSSMEPTLKEGDLIQIEYTNLENVKRGDMLIINPGKEYAKITEKYLKRCMGLPGDEKKVIEAINQQEFIIRNGELLKEPYTSNYYEVVIESLDTHGGTITDELIVGQDSVYVLGDNRKSYIYPEGGSERFSLDSREFGAVKVNPKRIMRATKMSDRSNLPIFERVKFTIVHYFDRLKGKEDPYPYPKPVNKSI